MLKKSYKYELPLAMQWYIVVEKECSLSLQYFWPSGEMFPNCWHCVSRFCCRFANNFYRLLHFSVWSIAIIPTVWYLFLLLDFLLCCIWIKLIKQKRPPQTRIFFFIFTGCFVLKLFHLEQVTEQGSGIVVSHLHENKVNRQQNESFSISYVFYFCRMMIIRNNNKPECFDWTAEPPNNQLTPSACSETRKQCECSIDDLFVASSRWSSIDCIWQTLIVSTQMWCDAS